MVRSQTDSIHAPVRRADAERYVRYTLLGFAATVILVRLFLGLADYPRVAVGSFHVAHVLWGGLILFAAVLLPLVLANRWTFNVSAVLGGIGVGLFIDEVGKFVSQTNDYFFPPAAPLIYAFFLLTLLVYLRVRRRPQADARHELYGALDMLGDLLDHRLGERSHAVLRRRIVRARELAEQPNLRRLADALLALVDSEHLHVREEPPGPLERLRNRLRTLERSHLTEGRLRPLLIGALALMGLNAFIELSLLAYTVGLPDDMEPLARALAQGGRTPEGHDLILLAGRIVLEGVSGGLMVLGAALLALGHGRTGLGSAYFGLLLALTTANLLVFYFDQFGAVAMTLAQFALLTALIHYRRRHGTAAGDEG